MTNQSTTCHFFRADRTPANVMRDVVAYAMVGEYINRFDGKGWQWQPNKK